MEEDFAVFLLLTAVPQAFCLVPSNIFCTLQETAMGKGRETRSPKWEKQQQVSARDNRLFYSTLVTQVNQKGRRGSTVANMYLEV